VKARKQGHLPAASQSHYLHTNAKDSGISALISQTFAPFVILDLTLRKMKYLLAQAASIQIVVDNPAGTSLSQTSSASVEQIPALYRCPMMDAHKPRQLPQKRRSRGSSTLSSSSSRWCADEKSRASLIKPRRRNSATTCSKAELSLPKGNSSKLYGDSSPHMPQRRSINGLGINRVVPAQA